MMVRWYYQLLLEEFGPVPVEQILNMRDDGTLQDGDLVRSEADGNWISIATMKSECQPLNPANSTAAEAISDLSELNFEFESSGRTPRCVLSPNHPVPSRHVAAPIAVNLTGMSSRIRNENHSTTATSATRKRSGDTKAAPRGTAAIPSARPSKPVVAKEKRRRAATATDTPKVNRSKRISSNGTGVNDDQLDEIFDDVFRRRDAQTQSSVSPTAATASAVTSREQISTGEFATASRPILPSPSSYSSSSCSAPATVFAAQLAASAKASKAASHSKKNVSISEPMEPKKIATIAAAVLAVLGVIGIWKFGLPFGGGTATAPFDPNSTVMVLNSVVSNLNALGDTPDPSQWEEFLSDERPRMAAVLSMTQDASNDAPDAVACREATRALLKIADASPDEVDVIQQSKIEFEKQIALVKRN